MKFDLGFAHHYFSALLYICLEPTVVNDVCVCWCNLGQ